MELRNCNPRMRNGLQDECNYRSYYRGSLQGRTNYRQNFNQRQFRIAKTSNWRRDDEWPDSEQGSCFEGICGVWADTDEGETGDGNTGNDKTENGKTGDGRDCPKCPTYPTKEPGIDVGVGTDTDISTGITIDRPPIIKPPPIIEPPPITEPPITEPPPTIKRPPPPPITGTTGEYTEPEGCEPIMLPYSSSFFPMGVYGPKFALCPYVALTECSGSLVTFRC